LPSPSLNTSFCVVVKPAVKQARTQPQDTTTNNSSVTRDVTSIADSYDVKSIISRKFTSDFTSDSRRLIYRYNTGYPRSCKLHAYTRVHSGA